MNLSFRAISSTPSVTYILVTKLPHASLRPSWLPPLPSSMVPCPARCRFPPVDLCKPILDHLQIDVPAIDEDLSESPSVPVCTIFLISTVWPRMKAARCLVACWLKGCPGSILLCDASGASIPTILMTSRASPSRLDGVSVDHSGYLVLTGKEDSGKNQHGDHERQG